MKNDLQLDTREFLILADYAGFATVYRETNVWVNGTCVFWSIAIKRDKSCVNS